MVQETKVQIAIEANATGAIQSIKDVGDSAKQMSDSMKQSGKEGGKTFEQMGEEAKKGAEKVVKATGYMQAAIKRQIELQERLSAGERNSPKYLEVQARQLGANVDALKPYIAQLEQLKSSQSQSSSAIGNGVASLDKLGMSAKATAAAMRGVPAQFTDIITSLQGGQQPMTVLLQQGGQLKDMFGGIGNAARALGGYVLGLVNPFAITAAAVGTLGYAFLSGRKESEEYNKALILTGNAAGTTAAQLSGLAERVSNSTGSITKGAAAAALAEFAASGQIAAAQFEKFSTVAVQFEKLTGTAVKETVKQFVELGKDPVTASLKLNETTNYLTLSLYDQIKALSDQGKASEAAAVAQKAWADAMAQRIPQLYENLGTLEKAWKGIVGAAKGAWDAMLDIGRQEDPQEKITKSMEVAYAKLEKLRGLGTQKDTLISIAQTEKEIAALSRQSQALSELESAKKKDAEASAAQAKQAAAKAAFDKDGEKYLKKDAQIKREIATATEQLKLVYTDEKIREEVLLKRIGQIKEHYAEKTKTQDNSEIANLKAKVVAAKQYLDQLREYGLAADKLNEGNKLALQYEEQLKVATDAKTRAKLQSMIVQSKSLALIIDEQEALKKAANASLDAAQAHQKYLGTLSNSVEKVKAELQAQNELNERMGLSKVAIAELDAAKSEEQATTLDGIAIKTLDKNLDESQYALYKEQAQAIRDLAAAKKAGAVKQTGLDDLKSAMEDQKKLWESVEKTAHDTFVSIFDSGKSAFDRLRDTLKNGLVELLYQMTVKKWVFNVAAASTGATSTVAQAGQSILGSGGGAGGGLGNIISAFGGGGSLANFAGGFSSGLSSFGSLAATGGNLSAGFTALGAGNIAGGLGSLAGTLGPYALAAIAINEVIKATKGETRGGGQYGYSFDGVANNNRRPGMSVNAAPGTVAFLEGPSGGEIGGDAVRTAISATVKGINDTLKSIGSSASLVGFQAALETSGKGRGGVFAGGLLSTGAAFGESGSGDNYRGTLFEKSSSQSPDAKTALANFSLDLKQATIQALQAATDIPKSIADQLTGVDAEGLADDAASKLLDTINAQIVAVTEFRDAIATLPLAGLRDLSFDTAAALLKFTGGIQGIGSQLAAFDKNFYSEAERATRQSEEVTKRMAELGFASVKTKEDFRGLIEGLSVTDEASAKTFASLLSVSDAFAQVSDRADAAALAAKEAMQKASEEALKASQLTWEASRAAAIKRGSELTDTASIAFDALQRSINAERSKLQTAHDADVKAIRDRTDALKKSAQAQAQSAGESLKAAQSIFNELSSSLKDLQPLSRSAAQSVLNNALASSNAGGSLAKFPELSEALKSIAKPSESLFSSFADFARDRQITANTVAALKENAGAQVDVAQMTLDAVNASIASIEESSAAEIAALEAKNAEEMARLDNTLSLAQLQIDAINGVNKSVLSLGEAMNLFAQSVAAVRANPVASSTESITKAYQSNLGRDPEASGLEFWKNQVVSGSSVNSVVDAIANSNEAKVKQLYESILGRVGEASGVKGWTDALSSGMSLDDVKKGFLNSAEYLNKKMKSFAVGTNYVPRDMTANIHEGERIIPAADNRALMNAVMRSDNGGNVEKLLIKVERVLQDISAETRATAQHSSATKKLLARVAPDGDALATRAAV